MLGFILVILLIPAKQKAAQAGIDRVVGGVFRINHVSTQKAYATVRLTLEAAHSPTHVHSSSLKNGTWVGE